MDNVESKGKRWIQFFFFFFIVNLGLLMSVNYIVDPFNIFKTQLFKYPFQMNERFVKIEFLEKNNHKFNGYLFGSSRIGTTEPSILEKYIPHSKFYNFTLSSANMYDYMLHLEYFVKRKYPIKVLYLQLDINNMMYYGRNQSDYLSKIHPFVLNESLFAYYIKYLTGFFPFNIKGKVSTNYNYEKTVTYNINNGTWHEDNKELAVANDCKSYVKSIKGFNHHHTAAFTYRKRKENIYALGKIVNICKKNNIKLYVFTTPHNHNMMDMFYAKDYVDYLHDIANITDFYNFSGYNSITKNDCNYYEVSHYRPMIGELIAARIFNDTNISLPNDFGIWITKENIDSVFRPLLKRN